jgi:tetratricopeptide (TPR) repeat protein
MKEQLTARKYSITEDPQFQYKRLGIPSELADQLEDLAIECQNKSNKKITAKLQKFIEQYPFVPQLKNYLQVAYSYQGMVDKAREVKQRTLAEHPDYLFAKLNAANDCISNSEFDKVLEILGSTLEIEDLYPERDLFHITEVLNFYRTVILYHAATEDLEKAESCLKLLKDIAPEDEVTQQAELSILTLRMKKGLGHWMEKKEKCITPTTNKIVDITGNSAAPELTHREVAQLYQYGLEIPREVLEEITALPRTSLIADLEKLLDDAQNRYGYFSKQKYHEHTHTFVLHALFLLKEVKAVESLPKILSFLENDGEFLDLWIGDHKTETLWMCLYALGFESTALLKEFLLRPGLDTYIKTAASEALCQMVLHHPEKRQEVLAIYDEVFTHFSSASLDDNLIDSEFLGLAIGDAADCKLHELLPIVKELYDKQYVSLFVNGDYTDVVKMFNEQPKFSPKRELLNIYDLYHDVTTTWAGYTEEDDYLPPMPMLQEPAASEKIGRNDPCPCGSGKKYKKCCGNS